MSNAVTIVGNLAGDPELRFTPSGAAVVNFTVADTPRTFDRDKNEWVDGETLWQRCTAWRELAENIAESLHKGTEVVVVGRLKSRSYDTREGEKRTVVELEVDSIGPSLRRASAVVKKNASGASSNRSNAPTRTNNDTPTVGNASNAGDEPPF